MKTVTYFRALLKAVDDISAWINQPRPRLRKRRRQFLKFAARILNDLADDGWTFVVKGDPATLPKTNQTVAAAFTDGLERLVRKAHFAGIHWYEINAERKLSASLRKRPWRVYAWRPWPTPPPLPEERGE